MHAPHEQVYQGTHVTLWDVDCVFMIPLNKYGFKINDRHGVVDVHAAERVPIDYCILYVYLTQNYFRVISVLRRLFPYRWSSMMRCQAVLVVWLGVSQFERW